MNSSYSGRFLFSTGCLVFLTSALLLAACGGEESPDDPSVPDEPSVPDDPPVPHAVGGVVTGLQEPVFTKLTLALGEQSLELTANGDFVFPDEVAGSYNVTVAVQPAGQACSVAQGSGTVSGPVSDVAVNCSSIAEVAWVTGGGSANGSQSGFADGASSEARFNQPGGMVMDAAGNLYVADSGNNRIRKVAPDGSVTTLAGAACNTQMAGDCFADGPGGQAKFWAPADLALDSAGNLYVADTGNRRIRKITLNQDGTGEVSTLAGNGSSEVLFPPNGLVVAADGNLFVTTTTRIYKITPAGNISILAGSGASGPGGAVNLPFMRGIALDADGNLIAGGVSAGSGTSHIFKVAPTGETSVLAGGAADYVDGPLAVARFRGPRGVAVGGNGNIYVADSSDNKIRMISPAGVVSTLAGVTIGPQNGPGALAGFSSPSGLTLDASGNLYVTEFNGSRIRKITGSFTAQ